MGRHSVIPRTGSIIRHEGRVLLICYGERKGDRAGWYNRLGGHVEQDEGVLASAEREILEETGLDVNAVLRGVIHARNFFGKDFMVFVTESRVDDAAVEESDEGTLHRVDPDELGQYQIFADVKIVLDVLEKLPAGAPFVAVSEFDGGGDLVSFVVE